MKKTICIILSICLIPALLAGLTGCGTDSKTYQWRMATSWSEDNLFYTQAAQVICERVKELSGGRLEITPYPAGSIVDALAVMEAVSEGQVEIGHSWSGYWLDEDRSFELFSSIPNQMLAQEWAVWLYGPSRGIELWRELYSQYNIVPFPGGLVGPEFGFFTNKPVRSLSDFQGLKLRVSGLAAEVVQELGASTILTAPGDIKAAMANGQIDGFEFSTPAIDWPMGFQEVAPYVSLPSWHQPSAMFETIVNQDAYNSLPDDLKAVLETACKEISLVDYFAYMEGSNSEYLTKFQQYGTQINILEPEAVQKISEITNRLTDEQAAQNPFYARVLASQRDFIQDYRKWEQWGQYQLYPNLNAADQALAALQQELTAEMTELTTAMYQAAQQLSALDLQSEAARVILNRLTEERPYIVDVSTVSRDGVLLAVEPAEYHSAEGADISEQEQVIRVFRSQLPALSWNFQAVEGFEAADLEYPVFSDDKTLKGSLSVLFKPELLLEQLISPLIQGQSFNIWAMQPDGRIIYETDSTQIGQNTFVDALFQGFPELISLGRQVSSASSGTGQYQFTNPDSGQTVNKEARWITFELYGTEWRLISSQILP
jgi:TRAP-type mannitol/chloroaromatic compound transport system substrate-binding protein